jgi:hypothetical protein
MGKSSRITPTGAIPDQRLPFLIRFLSKTEEARCTDGDCRHRLNGRSEGGSYRKKQFPRPGLLDAAHDYVIIGKVRAQASTVGQYRSADIANPENVGLLLNTIK